MRSRMSRRSFLGAAGSIGLLALLPPRRVEALLAAAPGPGQAGRFLTARELDTLRAVTARLIPGPPDDPDPGAVEAHCAGAIDLLLGAFGVNPTMVFAGGQYSHRAGAALEHFVYFVVLDAPHELGWRIRLEGSR